MPSSACFRLHFCRRGHYNISLLFLSLSCVPFFNILLYIHRQLIRQEDPTKKCCLGEAVSSINHTTYRLYTTHNPQASRPPPPPLSPSLPLCVRLSVSHLTRKKRAPSFSRSAFHMSTRRTRTFQPKTDAQTYKAARVGGCWERENQGT